jgi:glutaminyl-peptide cyclotransferase
MYVLDSYRYTQTRSAAPQKGNMARPPKKLGNVTTKSVAIQSTSSSRNRKELAEEPHTATAATTSDTSSLEPPKRWNASAMIGVIVSLVGALLAIFSARNGLPGDTGGHMGMDESPAQHIQLPPTPPLRVHPHFAVLQILPHDPGAFTQGLTCDGTGTVVWEGTGMYGQSELRRVDPQTGRVLASIALQGNVFGEGISFYETKDQDEDDSLQSTQRRIIQFTWKEKKGWIYNADTLQVIQEFTYETTTGDGWGITYNPTRHEFIVTDGSSYLHFWDAETLQEIRKLEVKFQKNDGTFAAVRNLNEVEYIQDDTILSNVWYEDVLIKINLETGLVTQVYDFSPLYVERTEGVDCFNGISATEKADEFWVTGKYWPHMYRVKLLI